MPPTGEPSHVVEELHTESSDSVEVLEAEIVAQGVKRKGKADGASTSKRRRHLITDEESAAEDDASTTGVDKEVAKVSPLR